MSLGNRRSNLLLECTFRLGCIPLPWLPQGRTFFPRRLLRPTASRLADSLTIGSHSVLNECGGHVSPPFTWECHSGCDDDGDVTRAVTRLMVPRERGPAHSLVSYETLVGDVGDTSADTWQASLRSWIELNNLYKYTVMPPDRGTLNTERKTLNTSLLPHCKRTDSCTGGSPRKTSGVVFSRALFCRTKEDQSQEPNPLEQRRSNHLKRSPTTMLMFSFILDAEVSRFSSCGYNDMTSFKKLIWVHLRNLCRWILRQFTDKQLCNQNLDRVVQVAEALKVGEGGGDKEESEIVGMIRGCIKSVTCGKKFSRSGSGKNCPTPIYTKLAYILGLRVSPSYRDKCSSQCLTN